MARPCWSTCGTLTALDSFSAARTMGDHAQHESATAHRPVERCTAARIRSIRHPQDRPRPARGNTRCGGDLPSSATTPPQNACQWRSVRRTASCRRRRAHPSPRGAASAVHTGRAERDSSESGASTTATSSARRRDRTLSTLPQSTSSRPGPTRCARATGLRRVALERKAEAGALNPPFGRRRPIRSRKSSRSGAGRR